jgi:virginiamycin B lyase
MRPCLEVLEERCQPSVTINEYSTPTINSQTQGVTAGPEGHLWFTEMSGNRIGRITPDGVITEFSAGISSVATHYGITAGPDCNLWFTELQPDRRRPVN